MASRPATPAAPSPRQASAPGSTPPPRASGFLLLLGLLVLLLAVLFHDSFKPDMAGFANDGPLGLVHAAYARFPAAWQASWADLNWLGFSSGISAFNLTSILAWILGPHGFVNFYPAITLLCLGLAAFTFFRQNRFHPMVCVIGGLAAALNSDFFSYACWGLGTLALCVASVFLALAALSSRSIPGWTRPILAGAAVGNAIMEGFDNGAIFSLYVAAYAVFAAWNQPGTTGVPALRRLVAGVITTALVAVSAALVAAHIVLSLVQLNITAVVGMGQDQESRSARWYEATMWSLPPRETLRAIIPGLYGYRLDSPDGGNYWGTVGSHPAWDDWFASPDRDPSKAPPQSIRHSGAGHYTGVVVVLLAAFALAQALRRSGSPFTPEERRWVLFWAATALLSLLFAFGRYSIFYRIIYALPYFNTIRIPMKFLHPLNVALVVLCGYGLQALWMGWIARAQVRTPGPVEALRAVFTRKGSWEARWAVATFALAGASWLAWLIYGSNRAALVHHLGLVGFDPEPAARIARHSVGEVALFALFLNLAVLLLGMLLGGAGAGPASRLTPLALGLLLTLDLARADLPWIQHYNWRERLASNPLFDVLRTNPHLQRLTGFLPFSIPGQAGQLQNILSSVYGGEWNQHQFRYYDIQTLEVVQLPRVPADRNAYLGALRGHPIREWELGNVRWLLSVAPLVEALNKQLDGGQNRFRLHTAFNLSQSPSGVIEVQPNTQGPYGLVEFTGALPRAVLFDHWRSGVPDDECLQLLPSTNFNPHADLLVAEDAPKPSVDTSTQPAGTVTWKSYSPIRINLATEARTPCVLLLNDRYDPDWKVRVDGREEPLLRANFLMRGVYLPAGNHDVVFSFEPPRTAFNLSVAAFLGSLGLAGYAGWQTRRRPNAPAA